MFQKEEEMYGCEHSKRFDNYRKFLDKKRKPYKPDVTLEEHFRDTVGRLKKWE